MLSTAELRRQELAEDLGVMMVRARYSITRLSNRFRYNVSKSYQFILYLNKLHVICEIFSHF